jgi:uncharacterized protein (DUF1501 family)
MMNRRNFLHAIAAAGAYSTMPGLTFAAANSDKRLIVIIQRGGMDALDAIQPIGDPDFAKLRPAGDGAQPAKSFAVDNYFAFHEALTPLKPLFESKELSVIHSVSTPYRNRSHFEAQDYLERGADAHDATDTGWVNRLITLMGGTKINFAADVGSGSQLIMRGPAPYLNIGTNNDLGFWADSTQFLEMLYKGDKDFAPVMASVQANLQQGMMAEGDQHPGNGIEATCNLTARMLKEDCRIASFSLYGWDTHDAQQNRLGKSLEALATAITMLKADLGPVWANTLVIAASEFGRTAHFNGTGGTDHGTGGAAFLAGGLLAGGEGGKVINKKWPGLSDDKLFEARDLMPTDDVRRYMAWALADLYGLSPGDISAKIFPGVDVGQRVKLI